MSSPPCPSTQPPLSDLQEADLIHLEDWRRRMIVKSDVRAAIELAYELSQQIAALDVASAFPAFSQDTPPTKSPAKNSDRDPGAPQEGSKRSLLGTVMGGNGP